MQFQVWLAFALACGAMAIIPGPGVLNVVGYAVSSGRQTALRSVAGMVLGDFAAVSLSMAGLGTLLSASAVAFEIVKLAGAAYLIWLGLSTIRNARARSTSKNQRQSVIGKKNAFWGGFFVSALHPKTIVFAVAFVPQFIDPQRAFLSQATILVITFCAVFAGAQTFFALIAASAEPLLNNPEARLWTGRVGGGVLLSSGVATALIKEPS